MQITFISSKDNDEERYTEVITYDNAYEITEEIFESLFPWYQIWLETSMRYCAFIFGGVDLLYCKCHKTNLQVVVHILILQIG